MERVVSGIRPTGRLHLGNYFGAMVNFLKMQKTNDCLFFIADIHSLTTHPTPEDLHGNITQTLVEYLASGLDPEKATIYVQSDVPEIYELYALLNMNAYVGELNRTTSFKDKVRQNPENVNAGLLTYPVLMAADILIHHAAKVPVGKDQEQHLEMTRVFARRFNNIYKVDYFKEPDAFNFGQELIKIPGLDGSGKMGKSEGNGIFLADDPKLIRKKVMRAVTDSGPTVPNSPVSEAVQNLFTIMNVVSEPEMLEFYKQSYANCSIRYGDLKKQLAEDIIKFTDPIYQRMNDLSNNKEYLNKVAQKGAERAREIASKTVKEVREIMGIKRI
ncbi:MAG: tryptophan--tRNA ligase [Salinivirgaceae bacterium]|nr:tryptophan--tRNA ligase [Salinivirgaceae bacterium]MDD4746015.1 tryptophan--tRNA ligase [Salinivirgaceae bacterium]